MSTTITLRANASAVVDMERPNTNTTPAAFQQMNQYQEMLLSFEAPSSAYQYKAIEYMTLGLYAQNHSNTYIHGYLRALKSGFDAASVTYNTRPGWADAVDYGDEPYIGNGGGWLTATVSWNKELILRYGLAVRFTKTWIEYLYWSMYSSNASQSYRPYVQVELLDSNNYLIPTGSPRSGYQNPHSDVKLKWSTSAPYISYAEPTQTSAVVTWKETGGEENTISVTTAQEVTIPAETWSAGTTYEWKVAVTDSGGTTTATEWYTLTTTAPSASAPTLVYPIEDVVDGTNPVVFKWTNKSAGNNTGTDLEFSTNNSSWSSPINVAQGVSEYTVPAGTLPSGTNYWRARAYNIEGNAGSWGASKQFTVISSPQAPYYEVTNSPRPTISWVSDEQQAFQVQMGDYDSGLIFGTDQSFKCPVYLPNGSATVRVRVMNQYNLWSEWSGTQITIANSPGSTLPTLTAAAGTDVQLTWTAVPGALKYLVYRDGALIGETGETNVRYFTADDLEVGSWSYSNKSASTTRCRSKELIPVANGTVISYAETTYDNYIGVLATTTSTTYRQSVNWTNGSGTLTITADSYMNLLLRTHSTPYAAFTPEDWNGTVTINTPEDMADKTFTDRYANGSVTYFVRAVLPGDNYAQSATVTVSVSVPCPMITALDGGWIELQYSTDPVHVVNSTHSQQVSMMVYSGHVYPVPEIAPHRQRSYQIQVAFRRGESGPFEALLGREVFLKDQYGAAIHGVIGTIAKAENRFYTVCSATLEEMEGAL